MPRAYLRFQLHDITNNILILHVYYSGRQTPSGREKAVRTWSLPGACHLRV